VTRLLIARSEAKARGLPRFFDGKPCSAQHINDRYTANGACVKCAKIRSANSYRSTQLEKPRPPEPPLLRHKTTASSEPVVFAGWTAENRVKLIDAYVDTGDIASARDAIGVSPSVYQRELEQNEAFAQLVKEADPKAQKHLEERAIQLALRGNDKLLIAVLKARLPEYRDSLKLETTHVVKLSDEELDRRIRRFAGGAIIDARFTEVEPQRQIGTVETAGREAAPAVSEEDFDLLS
jgi:hypothetical protein